MTDTICERAALAATVTRLAADLAEAQSDCALLKRLNEAEARAKRIAAELRQAQTQLAEASAAEIAARREAAVASFRDISVTEVIGPAGDSLIHRVYTIALSRTVWDGYESVPTTVRYAGFDAVPADVLAHLIERYPERIPTAIMALCPDDPWEALSRYFVGKRRGYFTLPAAA